MNHNRKNDTKKLVVLGLLSAIAFLCVFLIRVPSIEWLKYEPKDVVITFGAFIYGPLSAVIMSVLVSFIEMLTISSTGPVGLLMNVISTVSFAGTATLIYKKKRSMSGAVIGLISGTIVMTAIMLLWNYLMVPIFNGTPRDKVATMLLPIFFPFNIIKGCLNSALLLMIYKPLTDILKKSNLIPSISENSGNQVKKRYIFVLISALIVIAVCAAAILKINKVI